MTRHLLVVVLSLLMLVSCEKPPDDRVESANVLYERAVQYAERGRYSEAEYAFRNLLAVDAELGRVGRVASHQRYLGFISEEQGEFDAAFEWYERSVENSRRAGDRSSEMDAFFAAARLAGKLGDLERERSLYNDALTITRFFSYPAGEIRAALNLGRIEADLGRADIAQRHLNHALSAASAVERTSMHYETLVALAENSLRRQLTADAFAYLREAEALEDRITDPILLIDRTLVLGRYYKAVGNYSAALALYEESWNRFKETPRNDPSFLELLESLAGTYQLQGRFRESLAHFNLLADLTRDFDRQISYGFALLGQSDVYYSFGAVIENEELIRQALQISRSAESHFGRMQYLPGQSYAFFQQARSESYLGKNVDAVELYKQALSLLGTEPVSLDRISGQRLFENRNSLQDPCAELTNYLVDELIRLERFDEALFYTEKSRHESLIGTIKRIGLSASEPSAAEAAESLRVVRKRLDALEHGRLITYEQSERSAMQRQTIRSMLPAVRQEYETTQGTLERLLPNSGAIFDKKSPSRSEIQRALQQGRTVVSYFPGRTQMHIFIVSRASYRVRTVPIPRNDLMHLVHEYQRLIASATVYAAEDGTSDRNLLRQFENLSSRVYQMFIEPIRQDIGNSGRIIFVLPPEMPGIPLHTLREPTGRRRQYMAERYKISYLSSVSSLTFDLKSIPSLSNIVAFGNPEGFDWDIDYEVRDIRGIDRNARIYLEGNASLENLQAERGEVLYLATEFYYKPENPEHSYFSLTREGSIAVRQIDLRQMLGISSFPAVILVNTGNVVEGLNALHPFMLQLNGSRYVSVNFWQREARSAKWFNENIFSNLSMQMSFEDAYFQALATLIATPQYSHPHFWGTFFLFGP